MVAVDIGHLHTSVQTADFYDFGISFPSQVMSNIFATLIVIEPGHTSVYTP